MLPLGISVQNLGIVGDFGDIIVDNRGSSFALQYFVEPYKWTKDIKEAKVWPQYVPGQQNIPYCSNNAYMCWQGYQIGPYSIVPFSYGLHPCLIKYHSDMYLKKIIREENRGKYCFPVLKGLTTEWTSNLWEAQKFQGEAQVKPVFFEIVKEAGLICV